MKAKDSSERIKNILSENIDSWEDAYDYFDKAMEQVRESMHPVTVFTTLYVFYSFLCAMRKSPEEGDIKELMRSSIDIFHDKAREMFGEHTDLVLSDSDAAMRKLEQVLEAVGSPLPGSSAKFH